MYPPWNLTARYPKLPYLKGNTHVTTHVFWGCDLEFAHPRRNIKPNSCSKKIQRKSSFFQNTILKFLLLRTRFDSSPVLVGAVVQVEASALEFQDVAEVNLLLIYTSPLESKYINHYFHLFFACFISERFPILTYYWRLFGDSFVYRYRYIYIYTLLYWMHCWSLWRI